MTDYNKSVNFAVKDTLTSGDPNKIVSGAEIDTEFNNIASASTTKIDKVPAATTGNIAQFTATGAIEDSGQSASTLMPTGFIGTYAGTSAPQGWLFCNGQAVLRSQYPNLFSVIGTTFGNGDGSTSFNVPDLRDRFALGTNAIGGTDAGRVSNYSTDLGDTGGADEHQLTVDEMPSHKHDLSMRSTDGPPDSSSNNVGKVDDINPNFEISDAAMRNTGGDQAHNNMPPFLALNYIIKT